MTINSIQDQIIDEFAILGNDRESTIFYIMELGAKLPAMAESDKTEDNIIKGCQSKVWLTADTDADKVSFNADSNTDITKGLISLLIRVLNQQKPEDILSADLYFIEKIGMGSIIGSQRSNGLAAMIKQMKMYALACQAKLQMQK
ncbi:SufE family protein [Penaeicola halotolerans]|uniref:SufE family protein n=1 Tax=Penaeicola halotolerans TaxID=2793196 RepID=UPI001CF8BE7E|nr:SufE family protein [Penaeicola halotolerans]